MPTKSRKAKSASLLNVNVPLDLQQFRLTLKPKRRASVRRKLKCPPRDPVTGDLHTNCADVSFIILYSYH